MAVIWAFDPREGERDFAVWIEDVREYETGLYRFLETRRSQLLSSLIEKKQIDDEIKADLTQALKEYGESFAAARRAAVA